MPYQWRKLSPEKREELLRYRQVLKRPWHRPPHFQQGDIHYHIAAACYEHEPHIGQTPDRMADFSQRLLESLSIAPAAWCVLPNHYHLLIRSPDIRATIRELGKLHGRISFLWNTEDGQRDRKVWHSASDRGMRNGDHFWATTNYIHHNPVKHGYVDTWEEWPFSSAPAYLEEMGREVAAEIWRSYPILDFGKGWDEA